MMLCPQRAAWRRESPITSTYPIFDVYTGDRHGADTQSLRQALDRPLQCVAWSAKHELMAVGAKRGGRSRHMGELVRVEDIVEHMDTI